MARWLIAFKAVRSATRILGVAPRLVFFCWLDSYISYVSPLVRFIVPLIFPYKWSGLYFHPFQFRRPVSERNCWACYRHTLLQVANCKAAAVLDEGVALKLKGEIGGKSVVTFPDIADAISPMKDYSVALKIREKAAGRIIIGLLGSLEKRKGVLTLLDVAERTQIENWFFIFTGHLVKQTFTPEELARVQRVAEQSTTGNTYFHFERIPEESQFNSLINECDILFAAYNGFAHSSNLMTKAAIFEKPIIVSDGYCMAERVKKYKLGLVISERNVEQCIEAIRSILDKSKYQIEIGDPEFESFRRLHSIDRLRAAFCELLI